MWRTSAFIIIISLAICNITLAQLEKYYSVEEECSYDKLHFSLVAASGQCRIESSNHSNTLDIYGNSDSKKVTPKFSTSQSKDIKYVNLNLEKDGSDVFDIISGGNEDNNWLIDLNANKTVNLFLDYGFGSSDINLSDTKVEKLKINTGSAEVHIRYDKEKWNLCNMDTFQVKVEMGSLVTQHLCNTRAKTYIADIGFGTAVLDLSSACHNMMKIIASVGAGSLEIHTPQKEVPTIIHIRQSPLCHIKLPPGFKEIKKNTFVNDKYSVDALDLRSFEIDVALGNITFLPPIIY